MTQASSTLSEESEYPTSALKVNNNNDDNDDDDDNNDDIRVPSTLFIATCGSCPTTKLQV